MSIPANEKSLLDLIARFQYLTEYKDKGIISLATYSNILYPSPVSVHWDRKRSL